jgi:Ca2+-transporting ATPase
MEWKRFTVEGVDQALVELETSQTGLATDEAKRRLREEREHQIKPGTSALWKTLKTRLSSSFLYLLLAAAGLSFFLGDMLEGTLILLFVGINLALETYQEYHSARGIITMKKMLLGTT